jgi:hypothetical protein
MNETTQQTLRGQAPHPSYTEAYEAARQGQCPPLDVGQVMSQQYPFELLGLNQSIKDSSLMKTNKSFYEEINKNMKNQNNIIISNIKFPIKLKNLSLPKLDELLPNYIISEELNSKKSEYGSGIPIMPLFTQRRTNQGLDELIDKAARKLGWVDGINSLIDEHTLETQRLDSDVSFLLSRLGVMQYNAGLKLESPRGYPMQDTQAYKTGFMVSVALKYGLNVNADDVPTNDTTYLMFMNGKAGVPIGLPGKKTVAASVPDLIQMPKEHEHHYRLGLQLWLKDNDVPERITIDRIRHPETLYAFRTRIKGETIPIYEMQMTAAQRRTLPQGQKGYQFAKKIIE